MNWAWDEGMPCCTRCTVCCTAGRGSEKGHCKETNFDSLFNATERCDRNNCYLLREDFKLVSPQRHTAIPLIILLSIKLNTSLTSWPRVKAMVWRSLRKSMRVTIPAKIKKGVMENQASTWPILSPSGYSMCNILNGVHLIAGGRSEASTVGSESGKDAIVSGVLSVKLWSIFFVLFFLRQWNYH